jgi:flagellin-specific chaperone FliS
MDVVKLLAIINSGTMLFEGITKLVEQIRDTLSEEDQAKVDSALQNMQTKNDEIFNRIDAKLDALNNSSGS